MATEPFRFRNFSVAHDRSVHKVGTDAVLLGAWVRVTEKDKDLLDIGTGSGVIALMLAQRTLPDARIDAIEIETEDAQQAVENVAGSPWKEKVRVHQCALQDFFPEKQYDLIVSNPPYFANSALPPNKARGVARHTRTLPYEDLVRHAFRLLRESGRLALVLPPAESVTVLALAQRTRLIPVRTTAFRARAHKPVERMLIELACSGTAEPQTELVLYDDDNEWTEEYTMLTRDFYLGPPSPRATREGKMPS